MNVCPAVRQGPYGSLCSEAFYINIYYCDYVYYLKIMKTIEII